MDEGKCSLSHRAGDLDGGVAANENMLGVSMRVELSHRYGGVGGCGV